MLTPALAAIALVVSGSSPSFSINWRVASNMSFTFPAARYRMHFDAASLPPVNAFWSITAYDEDGYFIANPLNRYTIGDRDRLKFNPDGSLDLYVQGETPGPDQEANRLPAGTGPFNLTIRLYWPNQAVLSGAWHPPALERLTAWPG